VFLFDLENLVLPRVAGFSMGQACPALRGILYLITRSPPKDISIEVTVNVAFEPVGEIIVFGRYTS